MIENYNSITLMVFLNLTTLAVLFVGMMIAVM